MVALVAPVAPADWAIVVTAVTREVLITLTIMLLDYMPMAEVVVPAVEAAMAVPAAKAAVVLRASPTRLPE